jgi:hypothetical protein
MPQRKDLPHRFAASPMSSRLFKEKPRKESSWGSRLGCIGIILVVIGVPLGIDMYRDPFGQMKCGHSGKESLFVYLPLHTCERIEALRYLDVVRNEMAARIAEDGAGVGTIEALGIGVPAGTPYSFDIVADGYVANPKDASSDLPSYLVTTGGDVHMATNHEPSTADPKTGSF